MSASLPEGILDPQPRRNQQGEAVRSAPGFDHIPQLEELLPKHRGQPGFVYSQVPTHLRARAMEEGWNNLDTPLFYVITGPDGDADMELLVRGKPIPGQSPDSGARLCTVDKSVEKITGHEILVFGGAQEPEAILDGAKP